MTEVVARFPPKLRFLFHPSRYKVAHGGRGSGKSWGFARALLILSAQKPMRILCTREYQRSIKESVHRLLSDQIQELGLGQLYDVLETEIRGRNGSLFTFAGLAQHTVESIKSYEGADVCWVEEGQTVSKKSWDILTPTIRKPDSEIWVTFNPDLDTDETYRRFVISQPDNCQTVEINYVDNPWFPDVLDAEREHCKRTDPKSYDNIWLGKPKAVVDGAIYADEIAEMLATHRYTRLTHDPVLKTHVVFDLGWNDAMSIIMVQRAASELRVIDYMEDSFRTLDWYSAELRKRPYNWGMVYLPHDGVVKDYKTGKSAQDILQALGWTVETIPIGSLEGGIKASRMTLARTYIDTERAARLMECLKRYRRKINAQHGEPEGPMHDEYSHGADCYRYLATVADQLRNEVIRRPVVTQHAAAGGWM